MKKLFLYLLNEKNGIHSVKQDSARNPGFLLIITGWGEWVGQNNYASKHSIFFGQRWLSPLEKFVRTPMSMNERKQFQCQSVDCWLQ